MKVGVHTLWIFSEQTKNELTIYVNRFYIVENKWSQYITSHGICLGRNAFLNFAPGMCNYVGGISLNKSSLILFTFVQNYKVTLMF